MGHMATRSRPFFSHSLSTPLTYVLTFSSIPSDPRSRLAPEDGQPTDGPRTLFRSPSSSTPSWTSPSSSASRQLQPQSLAVLCWSMEQMRLQPKPWITELMLQGGWVNTEQMMLSLRDYLHPDCICLGTCPPPSVPYLEFPYLLFIISNIA